MVVVDDSDEVVTVGSLVVVAGASDEVVTVGSLVVVVVAVSDVSGRVAVDGSVVVSVSVG